MTDNSLIEDFADETREHLEEIEGCVLRLESDPTDSELLNTIFRSMHTIKGASEYLGFERIARLSHRLENLLDAFREGKLLADKLAVAVLIDARDRISKLVSQVETIGQEESTIEDLLDRVEAITSGPAAPAEETPAVYGSEADTELFGIFIDQLTSGLEKLLETAGRIARQEEVVEAVQAMAEQVDRLSSTSNYMGYDALSAQYNSMQEGINEFTTRCASADASELKAFLKETIGTTIEQIQQLFPEASFETVESRFQEILSDRAAVLADFEDIVIEEEGHADDADDFSEEPVLCLDPEDDIVPLTETQGPSVDSVGETDNSLIEDFVDETREHLEEIEGCVLRLESDPTDSELLNTIFRSMHTIKGASEYLGFERIARLSHRLENLLDAFREGKLLADKLAVAVLIDARDRISKLVSQVETTGQEESTIEDLLDRVEVITSGPATPAEETPAVYGSEADTELFGIFIDQLTSGLEKLLETAGRIARQEEVVEAVQAMAEQVDRLSSTSNYMGYDALLSLYDTMREDITEFSTRCASADASELKAFLKATIGKAIEQIQQLFPEASFETVESRFQEILSDRAAVLADFEDIVIEEEGHANDADDFSEEPVLCLDPEDDIVPLTETQGPSGDREGETDNPLVEDFADETREHLEEIEGCLLRLESDPTDNELLNTIFRSMHTIKGASEYLGFERIARLSHCLENLLDAFRESKLLVDKVAVDVLIDARDRISELVSQVEATGREDLAIEDLLDRVEAITSGPPAPAEEKTAVYGSEADTELFGIFIDQLTSELKKLLETAGRFARQEEVVEAVQAMVEQVDRLVSTSNYMGYDALSAQYETLRENISTFSAGCATADETERKVFLQTTIGPAIEQIKQFFPEAPSLSAIDITVLNTISIDAANSKPIEEKDLLPSSTFDQLLEGLPSIDDQERNRLLSRSLDETFSSMMGADEAHEERHEADEDPIARQLSSAINESEIESKPWQGSFVDTRQTSLFDDFVDDSNNQMTIPLEEALKATNVESPSLDDESLELWPKAEELNPHIPDLPIVESEIAIPTVDFSRPSVPDPTPLEAETQESFTARSSARKSIRVDADKVDHLMNQVGELVVNRSSFAQLFAEMRELSSYLYQRFQMDKSDQRLINGLTNRLNDAATFLGRVTSDLQEQVMKVRMLPISRLFNRYPRLVHDLLKDADKKVQLQFRGEDTELDRMVIEQLADPMIHIIRNAVDHGIETVEERKRKGKPESGILLLEAYHEGSNVVIEVTDDGKGIDFSRIRQKAVEKNLADRKALEEMDERALIDMIMLPGFSTTDKITHTSGRGVGMDVVKQSIEKINGAFIVDTRQDVGTRFRIKIPLTLAIIPAMMIKCAGRHFTVPMSAVEETLRIDPGEIFTVDGSEIMHLREEPLPLVKLTELLNVKTTATADRDERLFVVVVKGATGRTGFIVDTLLGRQEVVIKPMDDYLQENSGFSGATILGDGGISLVLDVDELVTMAKDREAERKLAAAVL